jgi:7-carboxy-7-deazaguanine synthase
LPAGRSSASSISDFVTVGETFVSLCGESTRQGLPAWFARLSGCNLRCAWCDTPYAWDEGERRSIKALVKAAKRSGAKLAVVTGGEPLLQANAGRLISALADAGLTVLVETNGVVPLAGFDRRAHYIVDVKPPSAKAGIPFLVANLRQLRPQDELKFLVADRRDFRFAVDFVKRHRLDGRCPLLISPVFGRIDPKQLAEWVLSAPVAFRLQLQLHKLLWGPDARGK